MQNNSIKSMIEEFVGSQLNKIGEGDQFIQMKVNRGSLSKFFITDDNKERIELRLSFSALAQLCRLFVNPDGSLGLAKLIIETKEFKELDGNA